MIEGMNFMGSSIQVKVFFWDSCCMEGISLVCIYSS